MEAKINEIDKDGKYVNRLEDLLADHERHDSAFASFLFGAGIQTKRGGWGEPQKG